MDQSLGAERYHLVCRECSMERLSDDADDADALRREHAAATGHRVALERVA